MTYVDAAGFRENLFVLLEKTIKHNEPMTIRTKDGNAVLLSERDYNGIIETLYLSSLPDMEENILEGINTPIEDCLPEDQVLW